MKDAEPAKQIYATNTGKSVKDALEYFPLDVQVALSSKIFQVTHTCIEQYKEQHPS